MSTHSHKFVSTEIRVPADFYWSAAESHARPAVEQQISLGWFQGVTSRGFRLVWENGALLLIAIGGLSTEKHLIASIKKRLTWVAKHRALIADRIRAILGEDHECPDVGLRVFLPKDSPSLTESLASLVGYVQLRWVVFSYVDGRLQHIARHRATGALARSPRYADGATSSTANSEAPERPLLVELRRAASEALREAAFVDLSDWRTSADLNLLRAYALLVTLAGNLVVSSGVKQRPVPGRRHRSGAATSLVPLGQVLALLGSLAKAAASQSLSPANELVTNTLRSTIALIDKRLGDEPFNRQGAFLGNSWNSPVPPDISALISVMAEPSTIGERQGSLTNTPKRDALLVEDARRGIASTVQLAQTFDDRRWPRDGDANDRRYSQGALSRVLAGHRLLLDLLGAQSHTAVIAKLGLAEEIARSATFDFFFTHGSAPKYLNTVRQGSLALLSNSAGLSNSLKGPAKFLKAIRQHESDIATALTITLGQEG